MNSFLAVEKNGGYRGGLHAPAAVLLNIGTAEYRIIVGTLGRQQLRMEIESIASIVKIPTFLQTNCLYLK
ncbi:hypothetical protein O3M35_003744 [Rhynocoris fuscipes]|uniref:Uncharacterized protein n=1 Tax=Rhynocoris fuscipes TaxID=488301 RepID=A0AAW1CIF1_9HEMI